MIRQVAYFLIFVLVLSACDRQQQDTAHDSNPNGVDGNTKSRRPARSAVSDRGNLRAELKTAKEMVSEEERIQALAALARKCMKLAPGIATEAIFEIAPGHEVKKALISEYLAGLMKDEKFDQAEDWADSLPDASDRGYARERIAIVVGESDLAQAVSLLPTSSFSVDGVDPAVEQTVQNWALEDPQAAAAWATQLPAGEKRTVGYRMVFSRWVMADSATALSWATAQSDPHRKSEAIQAMAGALGNQPDAIRDYLLESAEPALQEEIQRVISEAEAKAQQEAAGEEAEEN